jgi:hypothetical protein
MKTHQQHIVTHLFVTRNCKRSGGTIKEGIQKERVHKARTLKKLG